MGSVCAEQHKFQASNQLFLNKKTIRDIDIPPRKLIGGRATVASSVVPFDATGDLFMDSPNKAEEALLQKFLPYNGCDDDDADPYSSDHFRMYEFKVRRCTRSRSHDWTDCPFAHPGEKARRRDPRKYHYSGTVCSEFRRGNCSRGDNCEFAHGVFECWLHPDRYRTEACKDGKNCNRKVCFFAHTPLQLRILPVHCNNSSSPVNSAVNSPVSGERKYHNVNHYCVCCQSVTASATSTLMCMSHSHLSPPMSPSLSPPLSPMKALSMGGFSPISRYGDRLGTVESCGLTQLSRFDGGCLSNKDALTELMSSLEAMNVNEASSPAAPNNRSLLWADVNFNRDDKKQFIVSPSTPSPSASRNFFSGDCTSKSFMDDKLSDSGLAGPDLEWVNDLLT